MRLPSSVLSLLAGTVATASLGAMGCGGGSAAGTENRTTPTVVASAAPASSGPAPSTASIQPTGNTNATNVGIVVTPDMDVPVGCGRG